MEKNSEIIKLTEQLLEGKNVTEELKRELEKELTETGRLSKLYELLNENELDMEKFEFMLRLISNDEELYNQIAKFKKLKEISKMQTDLETLKTNLEETSRTIKQQINNLNLSVKPKTNIPVLKMISIKKAERKNKDILKTKLDLIIETIKQSRKKTENKELKEECTKGQNLKETLDMLYKHCELGNIDEINKLGIELDKKYTKILKNIDDIIKKYTSKYKEKKQETEKFDPRLREYTFNRKNNYVTAAIERWSKKNYIKFNKETNELRIEIPEEEQYSVRLIVYGLVALHQLNKTSTQKIELKYIKNNIPNNTTIFKENSQISSPKIYNSKKKK